MIIKLTPIRCCGEHGIPSNGPQDVLKRSGPPRVTSLSSERQLILTLLYLLLL